MLSVSESTQLGWLVTDSEGKTLYRFDKDSAKPPKSTCDSDCASKWPPVPAKGQPMTAGVDPTLVGSVTRADGTKQLTLDGWPLYRFTEDRQPGDIKGQGKGGTWFAAAPNGQKVTAPGDRRRSRAPAEATTEVPCVPEDSSSHC